MAMFNFKSPLCERGSVIIRICHCERPNRACLHALPNDTDQGLGAGEIIRPRELGGCLSDVGELEP
jgi:hypothetical protein